MVGPGVYMVLRFFIYFPPIPLIFFPKINGKGGENLESLKKILAILAAFKRFFPSVIYDIYLWHGNISFFSNSVQRSWLYKPIDIADTCGFTGPGIRTHASVDIADTWLGQLVACT